MTIINGSEQIPYDVYPMRTDTTRDYGRAHKIMLREGLLRYEKCKGLEMCAAHADSLIRRALELIEENRYYS